MLLLTIICCFLDMCVYFRSIQLLGIKWVLMPCVQFVGIWKWTCQGCFSPGTPHGGYETRDSSNSVYVWRRLRLFFDLEGTLANYRVHPHLSSYPFPVTGVLGELTCLWGPGPSPWSTIQQIFPTVSAEIKYVCTCLLITLSFTIGLGIFGLLCAAVLWRIISTGLWSSWASHSVARVDSM